jgi:hypothetical protein
MYEFIVTYASMALYKQSNSAYEFRVTSTGKIAMQESSYYNSYNW